MFKNLIRLFKTRERLFTILIISILNFISSTIFISIYNKTNGTSLFSQISYVTNLITFCVALANASLGALLIVEKKDSQKLNQIFLFNLKFTLLSFIIYSPILIYIIDRTLHLSFLDITNIILYGLGLSFFQNYSILLLRQEKIIRFLYYNLKILFVSFLIIYLTQSFFPISNPLIRRLLPFSVSYLLFIDINLIKPSNKVWNNFILQLKNNYTYILLMIPNIVFGFFASNYDRVYIINEKLSIPNQYFYFVTIISTSNFIYDSYYKSVLNKIREISFKNYFKTIFLFSFLMFLPYCLLIYGLLTYLKHLEFFNLFLILILYLNYFIQGLNMYYNHKIVRNNRAKYISIANIFSGLLMIGLLNLLHIHSFINISIVLLISNFIAFLILYYNSRNIYD